MNWSKLIITIRCWTAFLLLLVLITRSAYIERMPKFQEKLNGFFPFDENPYRTYYTLNAWYTVIYSGVFFLFYIYAIYSKKNLQKIIRAIFVFGFTVIYLALNSYSIARRRAGQDIEDGNDKDGHSPYNCYYKVVVKGKLITSVPQLPPSVPCLLLWASIFLSIVSGCFVMLEVILTYLKGHLVVPKKMIGQA